MGSAVLIAETTLLIDDLVLTPINHLEGALRGGVMGPSDQALLRRTVQFSRVITPVENIQVWNATSDGFSFVISHESRIGPGLRGPPGFVASWRPLYQNRDAIRITAWSVGFPRRALHWTWSDDT